MGKTKTAAINETEKSESVEPKERDVVKKSDKARKSRGSKYKEARAKVDASKHYELERAIELVKETSYTKFDGAVELHLKVKKLGLSASVNLPHSTGKTIKIEVADDKTVEKLKSGIIDFDVLLATAESMPMLVPFARLLGPKGLMPNPKNGTLIKNEEDAKKFDNNKISLKTEKKVPLMHLSVGKVGMECTELFENIEAVFTAVGHNQIVSAVIGATMGPGVKIAVS